MAEENLNKDLDLPNEDSVGEKIINGIKSNISFLIVVTISIVFVFTGFIKIDFQVGDYRTIICGSIIGVMVGWIIKSLLGRQGMINGLASKKCVDVQTTYDNRCIDNNSYSEYYPVYCEIKNEQKVKNYQTTILTSVNLKYSMFIEGKYDDSESYTNIKGEKVLFTKKQKKALKKARNPRIVCITPDYLTNEMSMDVLREKREVSTKRYESSRNGKTLVSALMVGLISGFFAVSMLMETSWANVIWTSIQVLAYISIGFTEYVRRYIWATTEHVAYIKRRINYLIDFKNMVDNKNNILFARIEKEKEEMTTYEQ